MSYLDRLYPGKKHGTVPRLIHEAVETAEFVGASYGFGYLQGRYREKASVLGAPADLVAGVAAKVVSLGLSLWGKGEMLSPHVNVLGNAGLAAYFHTHGVGAGSQKAGIKRILVHESDVAKVKKVLPDATVLGAIGKAPHGDMLTPDMIQSLAVD